MDCSKSVEFLGIDVHKNTLVLDGRSLKLNVAKELANDQSGFETLIRALGKSPYCIQVVFEATGNYHLPLALALWQAQVPLSIVNGARVRQFANALGRAKTDAIDQELIRRFAESIKPAAQPAPSATMRELQQIVSRRLDLVASRVREQNRLGQCLHQTIKKQLKMSIEFLDKQLKQLDKLMRELVSAEPELEAKVALLMKTDGVGFLTAVELLVVLPEMGQLNRRQISRLAGVAPVNNDSGKGKHKRFLGKGRAIGPILYMAALTATRYNVVLKAFYQRLLNRGKPKKVALAAVMHKLLIYLNSVLKDFATQSSQPVPAQAG